VSTVMNFCFYRSREYLGRLRIRGCRPASYCLRNTVLCDNNNKKEGIPLGVLFMKTQPRWAGGSHPRVNKHTANGRSFFIGVPPKVFNAETICSTICVYLQM
jgi:hypothetical protein